MFITSRSGAHTTTRHSQLSLAFLEKAQEDLLPYRRDNDGFALPMMGTIEIRLPYSLDFPHLGTILRKDLSKLRCAKLQRVQKQPPRNGSA